MAAANTDLLRKSKSNFTTTLSSSISDSDTTIPLSSTTGLPTDTAITLTIDRVDANGTALATTERVVGVISGNNLTNAVRENDGSTAQAHASGAVVECVWDADSLNDIIDAVLVNHDQAGGHKADAIDAITEIKSTLKSGADVTLVTGTKGTTNYTAKWNVDGDLVDGFEVLDEDNMASDSNTKLATQQSIKAYVDGVGGISDLVDDTTPQLGGDLSLNGHNIDFPTTADVSDCLDEDDMTSNSATKLATQQSIKAYVDNGSVNRKVNVGNKTELTISGGIITITSSFHQVDTEGDAASDDLDTINGGATGDLLFLQSSNNARNVVLKDGTGNLALAGDFTLESTNDSILLIYTGTVWRENSRSTN